MEQVWSLLVLECGFRVDPTKAAISILTSKKKCYGNRKAVSVEA